MRVARKTFALAPLLEQRRLIERRCLQAWLPLERERARCAAELERLDTVSRESCGSFTTTYWWQAQTALAVRTVRERLTSIEEACRRAQLELNEAGLQRRVLEKLEERCNRIETERRARLQRRVDDEANRAARSEPLTRAP